MKTYNQAVSMGVLSFSAWGERDSIKFLDAVEETSAENIIYEFIVRIYQRSLARRLELDSWFNDTEISGKKLLALDVPTDYELRCRESQYQPNLVREVEQQENELAEKIGSHQKQYMANLSKLKKIMQAIENPGESEPFINKIQRKNFPFYFRSWMKVLIL